jgi:hypothetical protein
MKKINLQISNCMECPFCHYDGHYTMSQNSGYDCEHHLSPYPSRIFDDNNENILTLHTKGIPDWCPLEDAEEEISKVEDDYNESRFEDD